MQPQNLQSNIWKLYTIRSIRCFALLLPVINLFYLEHGLSARDLIMVEAYFCAMITLLEFPSGYFADRIGRRYAMIIGSVCAAIGLSVYAYSATLGGFLVAETILAIAVSFTSGADSALIYDTLHALGRKEENMKIRGRYLSSGLVSEALGCVAGGALAMVSLRAPLAFQAAITFLAVPLSFSLKEPITHVQEAPKENTVKKMISLLKYSLHEHAVIKWIIIFSSIISASTLTMLWLIQPYLDQVGVQKEWYGMIWAGLLLSSALFSLLAERIEYALGKKWSIVMLIAIPVCGFMMLGMFHYVWAASFLLCFYLVRGIGTPVLEHYLQDLLTADIRASILSVTSLGSRMMFIMVGPAVGTMSKSGSLSSALLLAGGIYFLLGSISLFFMRKHRIL